jgi:hypothetical protein
MVVAIGRCDNKGDVEGRNIELNGDVLGADDGNGAADCDGNVDGDTTNITKLGLTVGE